MDVQCAKAFLQELRIRVDDSTTALQGFSTFLLVLDAMDEQEVSVTFRSAAQHFKGNGNSANLFFIGKRDIPGAWVDKGNVCAVSCFVAVLQLESTMSKQNFTRYLCTWLKNQRIPAQVVDAVARQSRVFTVRECEAMGLRFEAPVEVGAEIRSDLARLREIAQPRDQGESREFRQLLAKCVEWMEESNLPDEIIDLPPDELFDAVVQYGASGGASTPMLTDGLTTVDRNAVQLCDAALEDGPPATSETPGPADDPVDSCDELERELVANQATAPQNSARQFQLERRAHEPFGYLLYKTSVELPVLTAHHPKQKLSTNEAADVLVEQFHRKYGETEPGSFNGAMLQIAECHREAVDEGRVAQKDRLSLILPLLTATYKTLFDRKAASISPELSDQISRIVLRSKCKNCGQNFVPSDQSIYDSDADGNQVAIGKKTYNTLNFCEARCEQRWQCFRCMCGRPLERGRFGLWINPRCSRCGVGRPVYSFREMDNILSGLDPHWEVRRFYPRF